MNKRLTQHERLLYKLDHLNETELEQVLAYVNQLEAAQPEPPHEQLPPAFSATTTDPLEDDLITLLSAAYENRRARQVAEWESIRLRAEALASARHYAQP